MGETKIISAKAMFKVGTKKELSDGTKELFNGLMKSAEANGIDKSDMITSLMLGMCKIITEYADSNLKAGYLVSRMGEDWVKEAIAHPSVLTDLDKKVLGKEELL